MDALFDNMLDFDVEDSTSESMEDNIVDPDDEEIETVINELRLLAAPVVNIPFRKEMVEIVAFDKTNNILDKNLREVFKNEIIFPETDIFTQPTSTTSTLGGYVSNVKFHEMDLIEELMADEQVVLYCCNYGRLRYTGYSEPVKIRKTNRGRKKKEKKKKNRKKQGTGEDFNSQITFVMVSPSAVLEQKTICYLTDVNDPQNDLQLEQQTETLSIVPSDMKVYKFKVFRTGKIIIPGVQHHLIDDVIECIKRIAGILNFHLHSGEADPTRISHVIHINPVMKNYKFVVKIPPGYIIDMEQLRDIITREKRGQFEGPFEHPAIFFLKYTRQDTKLSIKFRTPTVKNPKKRTRINIFMRGKINILGALDSVVTTQICEYLHFLFATYHKEIIVPEGFQHVHRCIVWEENIAQLSDDEQSSAIHEFTNQLPPLPELTTDDYQSIMEFIDEVYNYEVKIANEYIRDLLQDTDLKLFGACGSK